MGMALVRYIGVEGMERSPAWEAAKILREGGVVIYPTETLYGIGADATNAEAVRRVNEIKRRNPNAPQIVLLLRQWVQSFVEDAEKLSPLLDIFSPGPLTMIAKASTSANLPKILTPKGKLAFRISPSWFVELVLQLLGKPITSTSVNTSENPPLSDPERIIDEFGDVVDGVFVFQGVSLEGPPSTMVDVTDFPRTVRVIREGAVPKAAIEDALKRLKSGEI